MVAVSRAPGETLRDFELRLLGAFEFSDGAVPLLLPGGAQRLIAFLALQDRAITRDAAAGALWPDVSEEQAHASLRSAIWRLDEITREALQVDVVDIALRDVSLDVREAKALAHRLLIVDTAPSETDMTAAAIEALSSELLPDWYDDWVMIEAEDWRQLRLHALESLSVKLAEAERFGDAIAAARAAIKADPLRESAQAALIEVHLAEGNQSEALAAFATYEALLLKELGLAPTARLRALVSDLQR
jgi:DNA-binding SARP family transcriptional activator